MVTKQDRLAMCADVPLFAGLSKRQLQEVIRTATEVNHPEGDVIVQEGSTGVGFHLILEGQARVTIGGRSRAVLGPGDYFGEISLIDGGPRTATVTAETPVRTLSLTSWEFRPMLKRNPEIAHKLLVHLCGLVRACERGKTALPL